MTVNRMAVNKNHLDQFFLVDQGVLEDLVEAAAINKRDSVLEIGAGTGVVTTKIAQKAGRVWAVEIDRRFENQLQKMPDNVEVIFGDALKILEQKLSFNKIVASLPSSLVEPLMHRLPKIKFQIASFLVPLIFVNKLINRKDFNLYLTTEIIRKVGKSAFQPAPKTNWVLIRIKKRPDPLPEKDYQRFMEEYLIEHPQAKKKNALMRAVMEIFKRRGKKITQNQARKMVLEGGTILGIADKLNIF